MKHDAAGFTLIELVITVAIVGVLASIAVPLQELSMQRARESELRSALRQIRDALDAYKQASADGRILRRVGASGYPPSLEVLEAGVDDAQDPAGRRKIYFLRRLPRDPFHPQTTALAADTWDKRAYASPPEAPYEGDDVFDVRSRSSHVGLNGVAYREW